MSWLVIGLKAVMTMRPTSNLKTFLHKNTGKTLLLSSNIVGKTPLLQCDSSLQATYMYLDRFAKNVGAKALKLSMFL